MALSKFGSSRFKESQSASDMTDSPLASRQLLGLAASAADPGGTEDANAAHNSEACQWASRARDLLAMAKNAMWPHMRLKGRIGGLKRRKHALARSANIQLQKSAHVVQVAVLNRTRANRVDERLDSNKPSSWKRNRSREDEAAFSDSGPTVLF